MALWLWENSLKASWSASEKAASRTSTRVAGNVRAVWLLYIKTLDSKWWMSRPVSYCTQTERLDLRLTLWIALTSSILQAKRWLGRRSLREFTAFLWNRCRGLACTLDGLFPGRARSVQTVDETETPLSNANKLPLTPLSDAGVLALKCLPGPCSVLLVLVVCSCWPQGHIPGISSPGFSFIYSLKNH